MLGYLDVQHRGPRHPHALHRCTITLDSLHTATHGVYAVCSAATPVPTTTPSSTPCIGHHHHCHHYWQGLPLNILIFGNNVRLRRKVSRGHTALPRTLYLMIDASVPPPTRMTLPAKGSTHSTLWGDYGWKRDWWGKDDLNKQHRWIWVSKKKKRFRLTCSFKGEMVLYVFVWVVVVKFEVVLCIHDDY